MLGEWMEREIREQPAVLSAAEARYAEVLQPALRGRPFDMVLLAARGSSDHAAQYGRYLIEVFLGIPVALAAPSVWTRYGGSVTYKNCLAVGISQSGAAPDVAEVIAALRADGHATVGITNTAGSRLEQTAETTVQLGVGEERSVAATKTYTASLLALRTVAQALGAELPPAVLPDDAWVERACASSAERNGIVVRSQPVFALGRGFGFSTALETALKLMECALIPAKAYSSADFAHGPMALAGHGSAAIAYDEGHDALRANGCEIVQAPVPPCPETDRPLWDAVFGQWTALHAARARGLDPDRARYLSKVTETR